MEGSRIIARKTKDVNLVFINDEFMVGFLTEGRGVLFREVYIIPPPKKKGNMNMIIKKLLH